MHLGLRLLLGFFLITGLAGYFVLRVFVAEVKPSVREVMEDLMVDTAHVLAELASADLSHGQLNQGRFAASVRRYAQRPVDAQIWGLSKQSLDFRVYVTDASGVVVFDSEGKALGQDYSRWRDVARTLRGEYGARATRETPGDDRTSVMHVAAPVTEGARLIGVLTVAKPLATVQAFIDRAERRVLLNGMVLLALSAAIGVAVTAWVVLSVRRLRRYADQVQHGAAASVPQLKGELGALALSMDAMRRKLEGREYLTQYVRALTHELKTPIAALRSAGELLGEDLAAQHRAEFSRQINAQTVRLQTLVERMLELSKLEDQSMAPHPRTIDLNAELAPLCAAADAAASPSHRLSFHIEPLARLRADPELLKLALSNLLDNARAFAPTGSTIDVHGGSSYVRVRDYGPGVPGYALAKLGERFFSTVRPDGQTRGSGLGLAIVRQIAALHGAKLSMSNAAPGLAVRLDFP